MSTSTAIGMVSESLRNLLAGEMKITPLPGVTVLAPDESTGGQSIINLYLYKIIENPMLKNLDWQVKPGSPNRLMPPPLSLTLFYLMTPYSNNDPQTGNSPAHGLLGDAMRVFYENPVVPDKYLSTGLKNSREEIRVILNSLDLDELGKVWATFSKAYRLSVLYEVSVVQLDMLSAKEKNMANRVRTIGVPTVRAPYFMPELDDMTPIIGSAGSTVTFSGKNLSGWTPYVVVSGQPVTAISNLADTGFQITLPTNLMPGFQEIQVNIGDKVRKTYLFEMKTPVISTMTPSTGPVGTVLTITGQALSGWYAYTSISRTNGADKTQMLQGILLQNDTTFQATIPISNVITTGSWQVTVEIYKRVTPNKWDFDKVTDKVFPFTVIK
jgi:hypothetical protein